MFRKTLKTNIYSLIAQGVSVLTNLLKVKLIALYMGPQGIGLYSLVGNFLTLATTITQNSSDVTLIQKYIRYKNNKIRDNLKSITMIYTFGLSTIFVLTFLLLQSYVEKRFIEIDNSGVNYLYPLITVFF